MESRDDDDVQCRKRRRRSIRNLRRQSGIQPFSLRSLEEEPVDKEKRADEDGSQTDRTVYGSIWCESQEPAKKKRRRSRMFLPIQRETLMEGCADGLNFGIESEDLTVVENDKEQADKTEVEYDTLIMPNTDKMGIVDSEMSEVVEIANADTGLEGVDHEAAGATKGYDRDFLNDNGQYELGKEPYISKTRIAIGQMCGSERYKTDDENSVGKDDDRNKIMVTIPEVNEDEEITSNQTVSNASAVNGTVLNDNIEADDLNSGFIRDRITTFTPTPNNESGNDSCNECLTPNSDSGKMSVKDSPVSMSPDFPAADISTSSSLSDMNSTIDSLSTLDEMVDPKANIDPKNHSDLSLSDKENSYIVVKEEEISKNDSPGFMSVCKAIAGKVAEFVKTSPSYLTGSFSAKDISNTSGFPVLKLIDEKSINESVSPYLKAKEKTVDMYDKSYIRDFRNVPETHCLVYNALDKDDGEANVESKTGASDNETEKLNKTNSKCKTPSTNACGSRLERNQGSGISGSAKKITDRKVFHDTFNAVSQELYKSKKKLVSESEGVTKIDNREKAVVEFEDNKSNVVDDANRVNEKFVDSISTMESEKTDSNTAEKIKTDDETEGYDIVEKEIKDMVDVSSKEVAQAHKGTGENVNYQTSYHSQAGLEMITENPIDEHGMEVESDIKGNDKFESDVKHKTIDMKQESSITNETKVMKPIDSKGDKNNEIVSDIVDTVLDKVTASGEMSGKTLGLDSEKSKEVRRKRKRRALDITQQDKSDDDNIKSDGAGVLGIDSMPNKSPKHSENMPLKVFENLVEETAASEVLKTEPDLVVEARAVSKLKRGPRRKSEQFKKIKDSKKVDICENKDNVMLDARVDNDKVDKIVNIEQDDMGEIVNTGMVEANVVRIAKDLEAKKRRRRRNAFGVPEIIPEDIEEITDPPIQENNDNCVNDKQEIEQTVLTPETSTLEDKIAGMNIVCNKKEKTTRQKKGVTKPARRRRSANIEDLKLKRYQPVIESPTEGTALSDTSDVIASPNQFEVKEVEKESVVSKANQDNRAIDCDANVDASHVSDNSSDNSSNFNIANLAQLAEDIAQVNIVENQNSSAGDLTNAMSEVEDYKARRKRRRSANAAELRIQLLAESFTSSPDAEPPEQPTSAKQARKQKHAELNIEDLEKLYRNKNFVRPEEKKPWTTINESPNTSEDIYGKKRLQRHIDFERPTQMKLRRRLQRAVKNGWDPKKKKRMALKDEFVKEKLDKIWTDIDENVEGENSLESQLRNIVETQ